MDEGRELGWGDAIQDTGGYIELPEGDYDFVIDHFDRARSKGGGKLPACNMAVVYFNITAPDGRETQVRENYILHSSLQWKLAELFKGVGLMQEGEEYTPNWSALPGLTGRAKVVLVPGTKDPSKNFNRIKELYPKKINKFTPGKF